MARPPVCVLLAGGQGTRLNALAWDRAKPAVPIAGIYRLIDFTLSNAANSGISRVGVLTQYLPLSLMDHIGDGSSWDMSGRTREIKILPPQEGAQAKDWYRGTAHAIYQNMDFVMRGTEDEVLILSGDHIYNMDYRDMLEYHRRKGADATIAALTVEPQDAKRFGIAIVDEEMRIRDFQEKPEVPRSLLGSMGIYIFNRDVLLNKLEEIIQRGETDIGGNLIPDMINDYRVFAFPFKGYWRDVGTLESYWQASMDVLKPSESGLDLQSWGIRTNLVTSLLFNRAASQFHSGIICENSYISQGCKIGGTVRRSILSPGVEIAPGAIVEDSIIFHDVTIASGCVLKKVIVDKNVNIGRDSMLDGNQEGIPNTEYPSHLTSGIILIGKNSEIPEGVEIGANSMIPPRAKDRHWREKRLACGGTLSLIES